MSCCELNETRCSNTSFCSGWIKNVWQWQLLPTFFIVMTDNSRRIRFSTSCQFGQTHILFFVNFLTDCTYSTSVNMSHAHWVLALTYATHTLCIGDRRREVSMAHIRGSRTFIYGPSSLRPSKWSLSAPVTSIIYGLIYVDEITYTDPSVDEITSVYSSCDDTDGLFYLKPSPDLGALPVICSNGYAMIDGYLDRNLQTLSQFLSSYDFGISCSQWLCVFGPNCSVILAHSQTFCVNPLCVHLVYSPSSATHSIEIIYINHIIYIPYISQPAPTLST